MEESIEHGISHMPSASLGHYASLSFVVRGKGTKNASTELSNSGTRSTLASWLLHHLNEEPLKGFKKVDQEPLDGGDRRLVEYKVTRRKRHRIPDVLDGKRDVVEDGLALEELDEPRLRLGHNEFDHRKPGRESNSTLKGRHRSPDQRLIVLKSLPA